MTTFVINLVCMLPGVKRLYSQRPIMSTFFPSRSGGQFRGSYGQPRDSHDQSRGSYGQFRGSYGQSSAPMTSPGALMASRGVPVAMVYGLLCASLKLIERGQTSERSDFPLLDTHLELIGRL